VHKVIVKFLVRKQFVYNTDLFIISINCLFLFERTIRK